MVSAPIDSIRRGKLLVPRLNTEVISRPRVVALLNGALDVPVTLITGPPGYGKTTALVGWLETVSCKSAWVTMDKDDVDLPRFVAHLVAAVQETIPEFGADIHARLKSATWVSESAGQALADALFELPEDLVLVLDDFQEVPGQDIARIITEIVAFPSPKLHLVISSRWDPQVSFARQRGRGQLLEIRAADLRFTYDETETFLQAVLEEQIVDERIVSVLHERTEGWIAGLRLASIALRSAGDAAMLSERLVTGNDRHVMSFLMDEMLERQPEDMQQFLVHTSFVDEVCGPLAAALVDLPSGFDSAEAVLERLSGAYVYEEREANNCVWYYCHPLFRTLLRQRLTASVSAEELRELYERASAWFAGEGRIGEAIRYALDAGNVDQAADLVERWRLPFLAHERWKEVGNWLKLLPEDTVASRPVLQVTRYRLSAYRAAGSVVTAAGRELAARIEEQASLINDDQRRILEAEIDLVELHTRYFGGDQQDLVATAERALVNLAPEDVLGRGIAIFAVITSLYAQGKVAEAMALVQESLRTQVDDTGAFSTRVLLAEASIHLQAAELSQADRVARYVLRIAGDKDLGLIGNWARFVLGYVSYERNDLDAAEALFREIVATREQAHYICAREAMVGLALIAHARGDAEQVSESVEAVLEWTLSHGVLSDLAIIEAFQARLGLLDGHADAADRWLSLPTPALDGPLWFEVPLLTRVMALLIDGRPDRIDTVLQHLDALEQWAHSTNSRLRLVEIEALRALALKASGDERGAANALSRSLQVADSEPFVRTWMDLGLDVVPLMQLVSPGQEMPAYLEQLVAPSNDLPAAPRRSPAPAHRFDTPQGFPLRQDGDRNVHVLELLTEREAEVLLLLGEHLTNQEIADRLYISPLTVKRHASNIYDKLGVGSRRQALIKANELGFLPAR